MGKPKCIEGMLVFQPLPRTGLGQVISDATDSSITHVGILHKQEEDDQCVVIESIGNPGDVLPSDWRIIPPHTLFYSDKLRDPDFVIDVNTNRPNEPTPNHALYDTLPGTTDR